MMLQLKGRLYGAKISKNEGFTIKETKSIINEKIKN